MHGGYCFSGKEISPNGVQMAFSKLSVLSNLYISYSEEVHCMGPLDLEEKVEAESGVVRLLLPRQWDCPFLPIDMPAVSGAPSFSSIAAGGSEVEDKNLDVGAFGWRTPRIS